MVNIGVASIICTHPRLVDNLIRAPLTFIHMRPADIYSLVAEETDLCNTIAECYLKLPPSKMYAAVSLFSGATLVSLEDTVRGTSGYLRGTSLTLGSCIITGSSHTAPPRRHITTQLALGCRVDFPPPSSHLD